MRAAPRALARGAAGDPGATAIADPRKRRASCSRTRSARSRSSARRRGRSSTSAREAGHPASRSRRAPRPAVHAPRGGAPEVRLPRALRRAAERRRRLGPRRGAGDGRVRGRAREGAREAAHRGGALPPLVRPGGIAVLWLGETASPRGSPPSRSARRELEDDRDGPLVLREAGPTPAGFPRRPGMAKKRPARLGGASLNRGLGRPAPVARPT